MRFARETEEKIVFQVAPMVDIVFLLLVFFMVSTTFRPEESELKVNLPVAGMASVSAAELEDVIIYIMSDGGVAVNQQEYDSPTSKELPQLRTMLRKLSSVFRDQAVIIQTDKDVPLGRVVDVLNACAASGIKNISFYSE